MAVTEVKNIPNIVYNGNQSRRDLQNHPICLTKSYYVFTLDEVKCRENLI